MHCKFNATIRRSRLLSMGYFQFSLQKIEFRKLRRSTTVCVRTKVERRDGVEVAHSKKQMPRRPPKSRRGACGTGGMKTAVDSYPQYWHIPSQGHAKFIKFPLPADSGGAWPLFLR